MKRYLNLAVALIASLGLAGGAIGQGRHDEMPHGHNQAKAEAAVVAASAATEQVIALRDGSRVVVRADGSMGHYSPSGVPVPMNDGEVMVAADGARLLMKGDALWRQIVDYAATSFALASAFPFVRTEGGERWVDLADGGRVRLRNDGTMVHLDAAGKPVAMADGDVMIAKDGTAIMMKGASLWGAMGTRSKAGGKP